MRRAGARGWLRLAAGLASVAIAIAAIHGGVSRAGGPLGRLVSSTLERRINANALFWTELGPVRELVDREHGRYATPVKEGAERGQARPRRLFSM